MLTANDSGTMEYATLMERSRMMERTSTMAWTMATTAAAFLLAWAIADSSPGRMLAVVFATAVGLYPMIHARQQLRLMAGYMEEFIENRTSVQWHSRLGYLHTMPTVNPGNDWVITLLSNLIVLAAIVFSWLFAPPVKNGSVISGFVTACGVVFMFHTITETARVMQTDFAAMWRKVGAGLRETERSRAS